MCVEYVESGEEIRIGQDFNSVVEIVNYFGHNKAAWMKGGCYHGVLNDVIIWFPTIKPNENEFFNHWNNQFNRDSTKLLEKADDHALTSGLLGALQNGTAFGGLRQRKTVYVFARILPHDGGDGRRYFKGVFQFNEQESNAQTGIVWDRTATEVMTYRPR